MADPTAPLPHAHFRPRPLDNLALADELESLDPIVDSKVMNILPNSDSPQILAACGRGARSSFRILRHGLDVEESVSSELPGIPNAVWTTKQREDGAYCSCPMVVLIHLPVDEFDSYIILSFVNGTLVLSIGETIEEVQDTGFLSSAPTLAVEQIGADALLQVHPHGIRHVLADRRVNEWRAPDRRTIVAAATNKRQVVVALSSAELVYFELDLDGQLNEYQDRKAMGSTVLALSIAEVPEGRQRTPFLVRHMRIFPRNCWNPAAGTGRWMRGSNRPYNLVGPGKHIGDYQLASIDCTTICNLHSRHVGCKYQQDSANVVRQYRLTKWRSSPDGS